MVGFLGALAGGAASGWSKGQLEEIKAKREEKLKMLDMEFTRGENALTRQVQREQIASSDKQAAAQLGVQERLGELSAETSKSNALLAATVNREEMGVRKELTQAEINARKDLQILQNDAAQALNTKLVQYQTKDGKSLIRLERPDGTPIKNPVDEDGNELTFVATDTDTDDIKNMKALMALGVPQEQAVSTIFEAKNANRELAEAGIFKSITDGMSTMKSLKENDFDFAKKKAREITDGIYGPDESPAATAPAAPSSAGADGTKESTVPEEGPDVKFPPGTTPEQAVSWAKSMIQKGKSRQAIKDVLKANKIDPSLAGL